MDRACGALGAASRLHIPTFRVSDEDRALGILARCLGCQAPLRSAEEWLVGECAGKGEEARQ